MATCYVGIWEDLPFSWIYLLPEDSEAGYCFDEKFSRQVIIHWKIVQIYSRYTGSRNSKSAIYLRSGRIHFFWFAYDFTKSKSDKLRAIRPNIYHDLQKVMLCFSIKFQSIWMLEELLAREVWTFSMWYRKIGWRVPNCPPTWLPHINSIPISWSLSGLNFDIVKCMYQHKTLEQHWHGVFYLLSTVFGANCQFKLLITSLQTKNWCSKLLAMKIKIKKMGFQFWEKFRDMVPVWTEKFLTKMSFLAKNPRVGCHLTVKVSHLHQISETYQPREISFYISHEKLSPAHDWQFPARPYGILHG